MRIDIKENNLKIAIKAAIKAGEKLIHNFEMTQRYFNKKSNRDISAKVDFEAEQKILDIILKKIRSKLFYFEERGFLEKINLIFG